MSNVTRGPDVVRRLLDQRTFDLRTLNDADARRWLAVHLERWRPDDVFAQQCRVRDLRRAQPRLRELERERARLTAAAAAAPDAERWAVVVRDLGNANRAVDGLTAAAVKRPRLLRKRDAYIVRRQGLEAERDALRSVNPDRLALLVVEAELVAVREASGVAQEERRLRELTLARGRGRGVSGSAFERTAADAIREHVVPDHSAHLLTGVRLGAAGTEFDALVVRGEPNGSPVEVVAAVEVKRNHAVESPDVLRAYLAAGLADRLLFVGDDTFPP